VVFIQSRSPDVRRGHRPAQLLWLIYALFFVAGVGQAAIVPLLPRLSARYGLVPTETALLLALPGLATLAVSVPAGVAADRLGARRVTLVAGGLMGLACLAQAAPSLAVLLVGRIGFGIAFGVIWTTGMAWLAELDSNSGGGRLGPSVTCSSVGVMTGPAVGGVLAEQAGIGLPFLLIAAVAAMITVLLVLESRMQTRPISNDAPTAGRPSARPLATLARRPGVAAAAGALVVSGAVSGTSQLLISTGLHQSGISTGKIGLAFSAAAVCYVAVSAATVKLGDRAHTLRFNALATTLLSIALLPALAAGNPVALVAALLLTSAPKAVVGTIAYSLASGPDSDQGSVFGILNGAWAGAMVFTPLLAGALDQRAGAQVGYLAVIVPSCLIAVLLVAHSRPRRPYAAT
jgi:MFS transporter, YNFM family, putative membrane transport protein